MARINSKRVWEDVNNNLGAAKADPMIELFRDYSWVSYDDGTLWCKDLSLAFGRGAGIKNIKHRYRFGVDLNEVVAKLGIKVGNYYDES